MGKRPHPSIHGMSCGEPRESILLAGSSLQPMVVKDQNGLVSEWPGMPLSDTRQSSVTVKLDTRQFETRKTRLVPLFLAPEAFPRHRTNLAMSCVRHPTSKSPRPQSGSLLPTSSSPLITSGEDSSVREQRTWSCGGLLNASCKINSPVEVSRTPSTTAPTDRCQMTQ